jgi:hypothetical protein
MVALTIPTMVLVGHAVLVFLERVSLAWLAYVPTPPGVDVKKPWLASIPWAMSWNYLHSSLAA